MHQSSTPPPSLSPSVQLDPLNSPHPVPWNWIMATLSEKKPVGEATTSPLYYYRSQSLISPDGEYAAYSRIQVQVSSCFTQSRVASILFIENLRTGELRTITPASPFADNPFVADAMLDYPGTIAILIPIAWSASGDRILAREFESLFGTGLASDFAIVWERQSGRTYTLAPTQVQYSNAILLGWSQTYPNRALFRAGNMGDEEWPLYAVDMAGETVQAMQDQPIAFGRVSESIWAGPQLKC